MRTKIEIETAFDPTDTLSGNAPFYLVGIGGAGMSGLARMLRHRGISVRGSDSTPSPITAELEADGISVRIGHSGEGIREGDQVVLSDAIPLETSPEVAAAKSLGCRIYRRSQLLGWLLKDKKVIAVTGTHGKTTTTGMIGAGLLAAGMDPTIVVGAEVPEFGGSVVEGKGEWAVVEACEAYDSFHDLTPTIVVLTNLEPDHLDYHGTFENLKESVRRFIEKVPREGALIWSRADKSAHQLGLESGLACRLAVEEGGFKQAQGLGEASFSLDQLAIPGVHNRMNASLSLSAVHYALVGKGEFDRSVRLAAAGIASFQGAERRLHTLRAGGPASGEVASMSAPAEAVTVIDDYAHHPTEIRASIQAVRERHPGQRLIVVFQPHLYSRTRDHLEAFGEALSLADLVILTDIYPAREDPIPGISSARIAELVTKPVRYIPSRHLLAREVAKMTRPGDVVVGMGAGNISEFAPALIEELNRIGGYGGRPIEEWGRPVKVAVVYGGDSAEREVSILSGRAVAAALKAKGYLADLSDLTELTLSKADLAAFRGTSRPDVAFLCVHGTNAEDGAVQGLFEMLHIPYTGSGVQASAIAMDKQLTKQILAAAGLPVPEGRLAFHVSELGISTPLPPPHFPHDRGEGLTASGRENEEGELGNLHPPAPYPSRSAPRGGGIPAPPVVVKPNAQGSTVGLSFVRKPEELVPAVERALAYGSGALIEEWIEGTEVSVPVLGDRALPVVEIVPDSGAYDFAAKYTPGATNEICPARLPEDVQATMREMALMAHRALGCQGATRTDMILRDGQIYVLEVNTIPGMTETSLLPKSAATAGISFEELCDWMVRDALEAYAEAT